MNFIAIAIAYILVSNVILTRFLGLCPFIAASRQLSAAMTMGLAATVVIALSSLLSSALYYLVLSPLNLQWLRLLAFMLLIVFLVRMVELLLQHFQPTLHSVLGAYLPLMTSNCAVLGVVLWNIDVDRFGVVQSFAAGLGAGLGFTLALVLMSAIRYRSDASPPPGWLRKNAAAYLSAGLMALAFNAFNAAFLERLLKGW